MFSDCFGARNLLSVLTVVTGEWRSSSLQLLKQLLLLASTDQYIAGVIQVYEGVYLVLYIREKHYLGYQPSTSTTTARIQR